MHPVSAHPALPDPTSPLPAPQHPGLDAGLLPVRLPLPALLPVRVRQGPGRPAVQHEVRQGAGGAAVLDSWFGEGKRTTMPGVHPANLLCCGAQAAAPPPSMQSCHPFCCCHCSSPSPLPASPSLASHPTPPCPRSARACWRPTTSPRTWTAPRSDPRKRSRRWGGAGKGAQQGKCGAAAGQGRGAAGHVWRSGRAGLADCTSVVCGPGV